MLTGTPVFGRAPDGSDVGIIGIEHGRARARIMTWGASLQDFRLDGLDRSLVLGSEDFAAYLGPMKYFGAIVGPVANRIAGGRLEVQDRACDLDRNEAGRTTLHGGSTGFGVRNWDIAKVEESAVALSLIHPDGLCGFPGPIAATVRYSLDADGALTIEIEGRSEVPTVFGPAFHGYWNLDGTADLRGHRLTVSAAEYLTVDEALIPLGAPAPVAGTVFDYQKPRVPDPGVDHNFCLARNRGHMRPACKLEAGGLRLDITTTEVGLQVYSGKKLSTAPYRGHGGRPYGGNAGIAIEPQFWPDSPNHSDYPSALLLPGQTYRQVSRFAVSRA